MVPLDQLDDFATHVEVGEQEQLVTEVVQGRKGVLVQPGQDGLGRAIGEREVLLRVGLDLLLVPVEGQIRLADRDPCLQGEPCRRNAPLCGISRGGRGRAGGGVRLGGRRRVGSGIVHWRSWGVQGAGSISRCRGYALAHLARIAVLAWATGSSGSFDLPSHGRKLQGLALQHRPVPTVRPPRPAPEPYET